MKWRTIGLWAMTFLLSMNGTAQNARPQSEEEYYFIRTVTIPDQIKLEVGGVAILPDGKVAVSTRRGEIWMIDNAYMENGAPPMYKRFASGLHEVLGLAYKDGAFYCTQRGELTRITDTNGDGYADSYEAIARFDLSGNYHEYAYGPVFDQHGDMYVTLNVAWVGYGDGLGKWHGWLMKIKPDGKMEPIASGLRSPAGFTVNSNNDVLYAENQGDWVGSGRVTHLEKGDFAGNAGGLNWTSEPESPLRLTKKELEKADVGEPMHVAKARIPSLKLPCVWFPHTLMGISTADILEDQTGGAFGPFAGQYFVADQGHSKIMRMSLEKVKGAYQGACYPFREGFASGLLRLRWGLDESIFAGMTSRGWASTGKQEYALQRLVWSGKTPFEMKTISARPDGFEISFTLPVDAKTLSDPKNYTLSSFTYQYHHFYGSPIINNTPRVIRGIVPSADGMRVRLVLDSLKPGYIHEVKLEGIRAASGISLLHNVGYYTLNNVPDGEKAVLTEAQKVKTQHTHSGMVMDKPVETKLSAKRVIKMPASWEKPDMVLRVGTKPGLKFDKTLLNVMAGSKVKLVFNNNDDMTHNLVIGKPGSVEEIASLSYKLGTKGPALNYVPASPLVLFHTNLLQPGGAEGIYFYAPSVPGDYPFVCTYPGHAAVMRGILRVTK